jgi:hypothetical protein
LAALLTIVELAMTAVCVCVWFFWWL